MPVPEMDPKLRQMMRGNVVDEKNERRRSTHVAAPGQLQKKLYWTKWSISRPKPNPSPKV